MPAPRSDRPPAARLRIGTAGWCIPRAAAGRFPSKGSHLERYARVLSCVEINSSFYRPHRRATYSSWAERTPSSFRFSVKLPRTITHERALRRAREPLDAFLGQVRGLGRKLGPLLVQLPPSQHFEPAVARRFFTLFRSLHDGSIVCEARHSTWFDGRADRLLGRLGIGRVAADPAVVDEARRPGGWLGDRAPYGVVYYRLHGSPRMYWSGYSPERLASWAEEFLRRAPRSTVWCILDNTAAGAAIENALELRQRVCGLPVAVRALSGRARATAAS